MFKIKLSILLLTSFFVFSCTNNQINTSDQKYSLAYIGGEFDGLLLKNYLISNLESLKIYDQESNFDDQDSSFESGCAGALRPENCENWHRLLGYPSAVFPLSDFKKCPKSKKKGLFPLSWQKWRKWAKV